MSHVTHRAPKKRDVELPPGKVEINLFEDTVCVWPLHCPRSWNCAQCAIEGKILCHPRFWHENTRDLPTKVERCCIICGTKFPVPRSKVQKDGSLCCCRQCAAKAKIMWGLMPGRPPKGQFVLCSCGCGEKVYKKHSVLELYERHFLNASHKSRWLGLTYGFGKGKSNGHG